MVDAAVQRAHEAAVVVVGYWAAQAMAVQLVNAAAATVGVAAVAAATASAETLTRGAMSVSGCT